MCGGAQEEGAFVAEPASAPAPSDDSLETAEEVDWDALLATPGEEKENPQQSRAEPPSQIYWVNPLGPGTDPIPEPRVKIGVAAWRQTR